MPPTKHAQGPALAALAALAVLATLAVSSDAVPAPHGSGWVPSGTWSTPSFGAVNPWPAQGWSHYSVGVDPWATQVVKKKPSYASLYPWPDKPAYRSPIHTPSYTPQHHSSSYAGWTRIPVLDDEAPNQWVAWVPEELGDFVLVRKDKLKPKKKKVVVEEEEEEEEPEPPKPKPKKKVKTIVEEEAPEEEPPKPKKKIKTIVEEEAPEPPKKTTKTTVTEDEVPPKKTTKTTVTTEDGPPSTPADTTKVTKTEVIESK